MTNEKKPMSSTRDLIVRTLLRERECTINDLVDVAQINHISVRHHIQKLEADGMVEYREEIHGVGRPRRLYGLTQAGREQFPSRYLSLSSRLLEQLKDQIPTEMLSKLLRQVAADIAEDHMAQIDIEGLSMVERVRLLQELLVSEGFEIQIEEREDQYLIKETHCPYYHVGQNHPEICILDKTLISTLLGTPAEKISCILDGDHLCTYEVPVIFKGLEEKKE